MLNYTFQIMYYGGFMQYLIEIQIQANLLRQ